MTNTYDLITFGLLIVDVILIIAILMQQRESGLSTVFGGEGAVYRQKRGFARWLHAATVGLAVIFGVLSIGLLFFR